ncbi:MAG: sulfotransferase [Chloroflexi bacterium]|nr:sulfotransferase [Chloroflexota bacterium]
MTNRLGRAWRVLITGQVEARARRAIPPITAEEVAEIRLVFAMPKFFIFGHARSGTTLLARLVRVHPDVHCNWQAHFFSRPPLLSGLADAPEVGDWLARRSNRWNRGRDLTPVALRAMADYILERDARAAGKRIVGDKSPNVLTNGSAIHEMRRLYPDGKVIYIVRDGRDTLISHRFQNFIDAAQALPPVDLKIRDDFARDPLPYFAGEKSIFTQTALRRMAEGWVTNVVETDAAGRELYGDNYCVLKYEALIDQPYETMAGVWRFLGVDPAGQGEAVRTEMAHNPDADWQQQKAGELVSALEKGKRGSWRELFTARDKALFKEVAGETLTAWGYEDGNDW